ncbi:hypothetical protein [Streptosporangium sandarakinum]|uniref:hypothetical protein n=1 Tax=Streptosporangium sandarakinum TaxID=1260955 RepID=UPI003414130A
MRKTIIASTLALCAFTGVGTAHAVSPAPALPAPTGGHAVGRSVIHLVDLLDGPSDAYPEVRFR